MNNKSFMCLDHPLIRSAYEFAELAHRGQKRKYTDEPYIVHPLSVAETIYRLTRDREMSIAAMLHDVVEDCEGYTFEQIGKLWGRNVQQMVDDLTSRKYPVEWTRAMRKKAEMERLRGVCSQSQTIKYADLYDNTLTIVPFDPSFAKTYLPEKLALLIAMKIGHPVLRKLAWDQLDAAFDTLVMVERLNDG